MSTQMVKQGNGRAVDAAQTANAVPGSPFDGNSEAFDTAMRMAKALATSTIVPKDYQNNPANVTVAMEYAHRLGASVLAVMQNLDVIHGRPSLRASFLIGTVNACGRFTPIRFRWEGEEGKPSWGCRAVATDRESGEECVGPRVTMKLAADEKWLSKPGSKWQTIPELMLMYRAGAWWSRVYAPDLSLGLHTTDEMEDVGYVRTVPADDARNLDALIQDKAEEVRALSAGREPGEDDEGEGGTDLFGQP